MIKQATIRFREEEWFGRVLEHLNEQGHQDGQLIVGPVNPQLFHGQVPGRQ